MAVPGGFDLDEDVVRFEVGGDVDVGDFVGLVEGFHSCGAHRLRKGVGHVGCWELAEGLLLLLLSVIEDTLQVVREKEMGEERS